MPVQRASERTNKRWIFAMPGQNARSMLHAMGTSFSIFIIRWPLEGVDAHEFFLPICDTGGIVFRCKSSAFIRHGCTQRGDVAKESSVRLERSFGKMAGLLSLMGFLTQ